MYMRLISTFLGLNLFVWPFHVPFFNQTLLQLLIDSNLDPELMERMLDRAIWLPK